MAISPNDRLKKGCPIPVMGMVCVSFYDNLRSRWKKVAGIPVKKVAQKRVLTFFDKPGNISSLTPPLGGGVRQGAPGMHNNQEVIRRLKTTEGHLRGIQRMVEEDAYCIDVIRQIQAVQAALNKISGEILDRHLNSCLITAVRGEDPNERERVLKEISDIFEAASKV
jgi:DNA-binding FrmR family transcriptional regulator